MRVTNDTKKRMLGRINNKLHCKRIEYAKVFSAYGHVLDSSKYKAYSKDMFYIQRLQRIRYKLNATVKWG